MRKIILIASALLLSGCMTDYYGPRYYDSGYYGYGYGPRCPVGYYRSGNVCRSYAADERPRQRYYDLDRDDGRRYTYGNRPAARPHQQYGGYNGGNSRHNYRSNYRGQNHTSESRDTARRQFRRGDRGQVRTVVRRRNRNR